MRGRIPKLMHAMLLWVITVPGLVWVAGGCQVNPAVPVANSAPTADAGTTQVVRGGQVVTLDGTGSLDPEGDAISYQWTQLSGPPVTLTGADTATPMFIAPSTTGQLVFMLVVSDVNGTSAPATVTILANTRPATLFVANFGNNNVTSYANPLALRGDNASTTNLIGFQTQISSPTDIVVAANGALVVNNAGTTVSNNLPAITIYDNATSVNTAAAPNRTILGNDTQLTGALAMAYDPVKDLLFVSNVGDVSNILVFANVSTVAFNGDIVPVRTITSPGILNSPVGINLDANDNLYVANQGANNVLVYANASTLNGDTTPSRTIRSGAFSNVFDVWPDGSGHLFVLKNGSPPGVLIFNDAGLLNGTVTPAGTITVPNAGFLTSITVDSNGTGYIVDNAQSAIYEYDNIAARNGTEPPDRTIQGPQTGLNNPIRLFLLEQ
jgi:hypothetical protein